MSGKKQMNMRKRTVNRELGDLWSKLRVIVRYKQTVYASNANIFSLHLAKDSLNSHYHQWTTWNAISEKCVPKLYSLYSGQAVCNSHISKSMH